MFFLFADCVRKVFAHMRVFAVKSDCVREFPPGENRSLGLSRLRLCACIAIAEEIRQKLVQFMRTRLGLVDKCPYFQTVYE